jgi:rhodanese-related sulfurtransferase
VYRFDDLVKSRNTLVVVNCGGRTRSIIGAQALINAGVPNRVASLRNGTQDWHLAGYDVLRGRTERMPAVSPEGRAAARVRAAAIAERFSVPRIDDATLTAWHAEAESRTLYVFDVRDPEEYESGHIPGIKHVAGGQLVQETDRHAATWGARIVCVDDDGVRAVVTAHWLIQMGWDAAALPLDPSAMTGATGPWRPTVLGFGEPVLSLTAAELRQRLERDEAVVIDLDWSRNYRAGHIPGAWYGIRSRLDTILPALPSGKTVVVTCSDGTLSRLAAREHSLLALEGGTRAWVAAGLSLETGATRMATPPDDMRLRAREQEGGVEAAMRAYLAWEINLAAQMAIDTDHRFRIRRG